MAYRERQFGERDRSHRKKVHHATPKFQREHEQRDGRNGNDGYGERNGKSYVIPDGTPVMLKRHGTLHWFSYKTQLRLAFRNYQCEDGGRLQFSHEGYFIQVYESLIERE